MRSSSEEDFKLMEDMFAEPPPPAPPRRSRRKGDADFVVVRGLSGLNAHIVEKRAVAAYPLLLALQQQFEISHKTRVSLTRDVWKAAGDPARHERETVMAHLRRMPDLVLIHEDFRVQFRYRVEKGPLWLQIEAISREGVGPAAGREENGEG